MTTPPLCICSHAWQTDEAEGRGRRDRLRMLSLDANPYPNATCHNIPGFDQPCALAAAWERGFAEAEAELFRAATGKRPEEIAP